MADYKETQKLNNLLQSTRDLVDDINKAFKGMADNQRPVLNIAKDITEQIEKRAKQRAEEGKYGKYEKKRTEEILGLYKDLNENLDDFIDGKKKLSVTDAYINNLTQASSEHLKAAAVYAKNMAETLGSPSTGAVFDSIDNAAGRLKGFMPDIARRFVDVDGAAGDLKANFF